MLPEEKNIKLESICTVFVSFAACVLLSIIFQTKRPPIVSMLCHPEPVWTFPLDLTLIAVDNTDSDSPV